MRCNVVAICKAKIKNMSKVLADYKSEMGVLKDLLPAFFKANWELG